MPGSAVYLCVHVANYMHQLMHHLKNTNTKHRKMTYFAFSLKPIPAVQVTPPHTTATIPTLHAGTTHLNGPRESIKYAASRFVAASYCTVAVITIFNVTNHVTSCQSASRDKFALL